MTTSHLPVNTSTENQTEIEAPELMLIEGQAYCTSLQVAEHFEKQHKNVLRDIEEIITQVIDNRYKLKSERIEKLFEKAKYEVNTGLNTTVKKPMYLLTRDGFTLLAMSYTGAKAMQFKLAYMEAFNRMETALKQPRIPVAPTISTKQYQELERIVDILADALNAIPQAKLIIWNAVRFATNTENVNKLTLDQFQRARTLLVQMHENTSRDFLPWLRTIERDYITNYLCQGVPSTGEMKKQWQKQFKVGLPQPVSWKEVALQLEQ